MAEEKSERAISNTRSAERMYYCKGDVIYFYNAKYHPIERPNEPMTFSRTMTPELKEFLNKKRYYTIRGREYYEHILYFYEFLNINRWILGKDDKLHLPNPSKNAINIEVRGEIPGFNYTE